VATVLVMGGLLLVAIVLSLAIGAKSIERGTVVGLLVGSALGVSGAVMQAVTRNPLADPGIHGVNAGASFAVVLGIFAFGVGSTLGLVWFAFAGAVLASVMVYLLGSLGGGATTPVRLALSGAALSSLLFALTRAITLLDEAVLDQFRFWAVGSLAGADQRWLMVGCALAGSLLLIGCNTIGRVVARPSEVQVGIMTAAIGGPSFVLLGRRVRTVQL
jgi:iron complex transport system permease protein